MSEPSVLISTCTREQIHAETVKWILDQQRRGYGIDIVTSLEPIDWNRNQQVKRFLASRQKYLFFLDSDAVPATGTIEVLLSYEKDAIVAPNLCLLQREGVVVPMAFTKPGSDSDFVDSKLMLDTIFSSGMSGLLIKREVIEKLSSPWFRFEYGTDGKLELGEDVYFYKKLNEAGVVVWCVFDYPSSHYKTFDLKVLYA